LYSLECFPHNLEQLKICQMMTLSLVLGHRLVNGAIAARFKQAIKQMVEEPYLLLGY
jgi:pyruvate/2-oxoglutarate dehydrogenase complex dihydrolipoamide acyltransferase (E2) component